MTITREPQYEPLLKTDPQSLGLMTGYGWNDDPKRLVFTLARYKFVAKMLRGRHSALEVGCGDAFGTRIVRQAIPEVCAIDFDPLFIKDAINGMSNRWRISLQCLDILDCGVEWGFFDAVYALDVLEHISLIDEPIFFSNIIKALNPHGCLIIGTPSLESQPYASELSKAGHVNCKSAPELQQLMHKYFHH